VVELVEKSVADAGARPPVRYTRSRAGRVRDRARNQAATQVFRATRAHGNGSAPSRPQPSPTDRDGDGAPNGEDCAPADPAIRPGAPDLPDLAFVDSNCDGIDGTAKDAIFVGGSGNNSNPGTRAASKRDIQAAVLVAALADKDVYVAGSDYGRFETASGVDVYGAGTSRRRGSAGPTFARGSWANRRAFSPAAIAWCCSR
jgi:hypothetical protein